MQKKHQPWTSNRLLILAFLIRLLLICYSRIHDYVFKVRFTDIDYKVFSDAAELVWHGESPFDRSTYRYTPLLAWLLVPNVFFPDFGKLLFCSVDVAVGWLLFRLLLRSPDARVGHSVPTLLLVALLWLFNPLIAIVSARGSADSIVCFAVLLSLQLLDTGHWIASAIVHGALAVHFKLYPVIYFPSIFLSFVTRSDSPSLCSFFKQLLMNRRGFIYIMLSLLFFSNLLAIGYSFYGHKFVEEFLLYHVSRKDIRHNFSPYFYPLYLSMDNDQITRWLSKGAFLPQIFCVLLFAFKYSNDLPFCWFLTTFAFVSLNKVCTSQYFVWYLCLLPLAFVRLDISSRKTFQLVLLWSLGQGFWLFAAYLLEFKGVETFVWIWIASLFFLCSNLYTLSICVKCYSPNLSKSVDSKHKGTNEEKIE